MHGMLTMIAKTMKKHDVRDLTVLFGVREQHKKKIGVIIEN